MRKIFRALKVTGVLAAVVAAAAFTWAVRRAPVFPNAAAYEFYAGTSSGEIVTGDPLQKLLLPSVRGESARYEGDVSAEIAARFGARLLFTEEAGDVVNYYLYSPKLGGGVALGGHTVNLHIAVGHGQTAAGTPLIFGGF